MILQWRRRLLLGMGLSVALTLAVSPTTASAAAVSTLTGESLSGISSSGNTSACPTATYSVSGDAGGPYAGTFSESGSWSIMGRTFTATFAITSGTTTISGSKSLGGGSFNYLFCGEAAGVDLRDSSYTATINTPSGNFHDEGTSPNVGIFVIGTTGAAFLGENFTSSLTQPVLIAPTSKDQCKNDGWKAFPQFQNQGQRVSSVQSQRPS